MYQEPVSGRYVYYEFVDSEHYFGKYYQLGWLNHTKHHIYLGDTRIATLNDSGSLYFTISDHLGSSTLMTNASGALSELDDYYPYGAVAYENTTTDLDNWYKFTGKELDSETNLQYFGARYYDNNLGRFTSIDPVAFLLHTDSELKQVSGRSLKVLLADPQLLNSYSYTRNNPVVLVDPDGNAAQHNAYIQYVQDQRQFANFMHSAGNFFRSTGGSTGQLLGFVSDTWAELAGNTATLLDPNTQPGSRMFAGGMLALEVVSGGEGKVVGKGVGKVLENLPDSTLVCRGGTCSAMDFITGTGVKVGSNGKLSDVSVLVGINGETKEQLLKALPARFNGIGEFTSLGDVRKTLSTLVQQGKNELHHLMGGLTPKAYEELFKKIAK